MTASLQYDYTFDWTMLKQKATMNPTNSTAAAPANPTTSQNPEQPKGAAVGTAAQAPF